MTVSTDPMDQITPRRQCHATNRAGEPCKKPPVLGASVCTNHGGRAPQVKRKAALRLIELVDPAIATLAREMINADKSNDRQRAANSILDRAGVPRVVQEVDQFTARELLITRLRELREEQQAQPEQDQDQQGITEASDIVISQLDTDEGGEDDSSQG